MVALKRRKKREMMEREVENARSKRTKKEFILPS